MDKKKFGIVGMALLAAVVMLTVAGLFGIANRNRTLGEPQVPVAAVKVETPKTSAELFAERMDAADRLIVKPPASWTETERQGESNLYVWVKLCGDRKLPWYYGDDDIANQREQICKSWLEMMERRAKEISSVVKRLSDQCGDDMLDRKWAERSHGFATNECARMEKLLDEVAYPLMNVTTNALVRRRGYRTLSLMANGMSAKWGERAMDACTKVVSGPQVFTNRSQLVEYVARMRTDAMLKLDDIRRCEAREIDSAVRLKEAKDLLSESAVNVEASQKAVKGGDPQNLKEQFTSWRRWLLKSVLILGE